MKTKKSEIYVKEPDIFIDGCYSTEHQIVINKADWGEGKTAYLAVHLHNYRNFFKRVGVAVKYIFGYKCRYGHWDEFIITDENYKPFKRMVDFFEDTTSSELNKLSQQAQELDMGYDD
jgi:hypothetical protein